jgi:deoxyribodipyrimidine photo-lyase
MRTVVVLFTRDLRVADHPALAAACAHAKTVVPLYVLDPVLAGRSANRDRFLHQSLADLRSALISRGGDLVIRRGDPVAETPRMSAVMRSGGSRDWSMTVTDTGSGSPSSPV